MFNPNGPKVWGVATVLDNGEVQSIIDFYTREEAEAEMNPAKWAGMNGYSFKLMYRPDWVEVKENDNA